MFREIIGFFVLPVIQYIMGESREGVIVTQPDYNMYRQISIIILDEMIYIGTHKINIKKHLRLILNDAIRKGDYKESDQL